MSKCFNHRQGGYNNVKCQKTGQVHSNVTNDDVKNLNSKCFYNSKVDSRLMEGLKTRGEKL